MASARGRDALARMLLGDPVPRGADSSDPWTIPKRCIWPAIRPSRLDEERHDPPCPGLSVETLDVLAERDAPTDAVRRGRLPLPDVVEVGAAHPVPLALVALAQRAQRDRGHPRVARHEGHRPVLDRASSIMTTSPVVTAPDLVDRVPDDLGQHGERVLHATGRPRQVDDERAAGHPGDPADSIAVGTPFATPAARIASAIPGISRSRSGASSPVSRRSERSRCHRW